MRAVRHGCIALVALSMVVGCSDDKGSGTPVAPTIRASGSGSHGLGDDAGSGNNRIAIRDDCDPRDPAWNPTGGCFLRGGDVTFAEFAGENDSPLAASIVGHQAWRNDPSYLEIRVGEKVRVRNEGGRIHTFTRVGAFGGGKAAPLNEGLVVAPECPGSVDIPAGGRTEVSGLAAGNHRFQCCIHPWMRALIKVKPRRNHDDE
ncbi:MAG: hypothetical protein M3125_02115 [Gemmatimonadota bacterium]|nr:hypothetical protein [Gemmatimonadota bacterium]